MGLFDAYEELSNIVIEQLQKDGGKIEYPCIGNIPNGDDNTEKVYEMMVAAPAFGMYSLGNATDKQKSEIEFLCALQGYRAQFHQSLKLAESNPDKKIIFKPTAPGLGVFGNRGSNISKAFYVAAKEFEDQLIVKKIQVRLQVYKGAGPARSMANALYLAETKA